MKGNKIIENKGARKSFARSLLVQAGYNSERMQNLGFLYSLAPLLNSATEEELKETYARHLEFFNTHPYLAGSLAAVVGKMENEREKEESISAFKQSMMGPFGALGDSFFWFSVKPMALLVGAGLALAGHYVLAVLVPLIMYNAIHLWSRFWSYKGAVQQGPKMVSGISKLRFSKINSALGITAAIILAFMTVCQLETKSSFLSFQEEVSATSGALALVVVVLTAIAVKRGLKPVTLFYLAAGFGLVASITVP